MKKWNKQKNGKGMLAVLCATGLVLSLTACTKETGTEDTDSSDTEITGKITDIDGAEVTLLLGELTEASMPDGETLGGDMPDGDAGGSDTSDADTTDSDGSASDGDQETPPELPDGETPSGDMPSGGDAGDGDQETPPEKPDGDTSGGDMPDGEAPDGDMPSGDMGEKDAADSADGSMSDGDQETPPELPDGDTSGGDMPDGDMPSGDMGGGMSFTEGDETMTIDLTDAVITESSETISLDDLEEGDILTVQFNEDGSVESVEVVTLSGGMGGGDQGGFGGSSEVTQGTSANTIDTDGSYSDTEYTSTGDDENALRIDGATVTLSGITVNKSGGETSNTENGDFYGVNAALLATNGATVTIENAEVISDAQNGNGVFSYGSGTTVNISDSTITTSADNSGGIQTTGGGTTNASNLTVTTAGNSSAAIRSDRGGGTVNVTGGTYTSNGYNSPAVYSTAAITVTDAVLTANCSEALVIEGKNSITLTDCTVIGNMSDTEGTSSDENVHNVMIYQSMSGDADVGTSEFSMTGGSLTAQNGDMFYITNTHCILTLSGVEIVNEDDDAYLLRICGNSASHGWGTAGENGAQVELTADGQTLEGDILVDSISTLQMTLTNQSTFTGTIQIADNEAGGTAVEDNAVVTIDSGCTWELTGDCTISSLTNNGTIQFNGYTITLADGTVLSE